MRFCRAEGSLSLQPVHEPTSKEQGKLCLYLQYELSNVK